MRSCLLALAAFLAVAPAAGCLDADDETPALEDGRGDTDDVLVDGKADAAEIRARIDGLTVWIDRAVVLGTDSGRRFRLDGRASRNLRRIDTTAADGAAGEGRIRTPRTFELTVDDAELGRVLAGAPLFVTVTPVTGAPATAAVWLAPRVVGSTGTSTIYLHANLAPVAGAPSFRSRATVSTGWSALTATDGAGAAAATAAEDATHWRVDWSLASVLDTVSRGGAPLGFTVAKGAQRASRSAGLEVAVTRLALTRRDPFEVWATTPSTGRAADDLRAHLVTYYRDHGADVIAAGGNTLAQAQAAVDATAFALVTDPEEDPYAHDLATHWVYRHRDVTYPGSDIAWFVVYRRADGGLVEVYDFN